MKTSGFQCLLKNETHSDSQARCEASLWCCIWETEIWRGYGSYWSSLQRSLFLSSLELGAHASTMFRFTAAPYGFFSLTWYLATNSHFFPIFSQCVCLPCSLAFCYQVCFDLGFLLACVSPFGELSPFSPKQRWHMVTHLRIHTSASGLGNTHLFFL